MARCIVIEYDPTSSHVFVYDCEKKDNLDNVEYTREIFSTPILHGEPSPTFYGKLDAVIVTRKTLLEAAQIAIEITPEREQELRAALGRALADQGDCLGPGA